MQISEINIQDIIESEYNPRTISKEDKKQLLTSIKKFGLVDPLIINIHKDRKNILIGGHQRLKICKELGFKTVNCNCLNLDLKQEQELNIRLNKNTGEFDFEKLEKYFKTDMLVEFGFNAFQFSNITFIPDEASSIDVNHKKDSESGDEKNVMLEVPMSPNQKKEIMLIINSYKENSSLTNGSALYEIVSSFKSL